MNRRNFNQTSILGLLSLSGSTSLLAKTASATQKNHDHLSMLKSHDGLVLSLADKQFATRDQDHKQFILTFDVLAGITKSEESIYQLIDANNKAIQLFMKPVNSNQLQAVFNQRTHA